MSVQRLNITIEINEEEVIDREYELEELNENLKELTIPELKKMIARFLSVKEESINIQGEYERFE